MRLNPNTHLILGPPGTGKTTALLNVVENELSAGVDPDRIAFVSFTRAAAHEARDRGHKKFGLPDDALPYFRTLHSMAHYCLGLQPSQVFNRADCAELGKLLGLFIDMGTAYVDSGTYVMTGSRGSRMLFLDGLARAQRLPLRTVWDRSGENQISWHEMDRFSRTLACYKEEKGVLDFTDMIERFIVGEWCPELDVVIVDEAQDLTRLQWEMVQRLTKDAQRVYVAGDDDQAIYTWSGADVETFLALDADRRVLTTSFRLPRSVFRVACSISSRISRRYVKEWSPRDDDGSVQTVVGLDELPLDKGSWLLLARNRAVVDPLVEHCRRSGYSFSSPGATPMDPATLDAVVEWERLRKGGRVSLAQARSIYDLLKCGAGVRRGFKTIPDGEADKTYSMDDLERDHGLRTRDPWYDALTRIPAADVEFCRLLLSRGESLRKPRIRVGTIHSVKGAEADNVLVVPDMATRTFSEFIENPDNEHRVFYVGVTRARHNLYLMAPSGSQYYPILEGEDHVR